MMTPDFPLSGRVFCAGKNYSAHIRAMDDGQNPERPLLFLKPSAALVRPQQGIWVPPEGENLHPEAELVVVLKDTLRGATPEEAMQAVYGYAPGIEMTDRGFQSEAKKAGYPWEFGKSYDGSAGVGPIVAAEKCGPWDTLTVLLTDQLGEVLQEAKPAFMRMGVPTLLSFISQRFTLQAGDVVFTGAPAGTKQIQAGDRLQLKLADFEAVEFEVTTERPFSTFERPS